MAGESREEDKYLTNYVFEVQIGTMKFSFSKISNITSEIEYEILGTGGNNDGMQFFKKPKRRPDTIIFERGVRKGIADDMLRVVPGLKISDLMILVKRGSTTERIFHIKQGIVTKISYTDLDAGRGEILVKRMEMQHTGVVEETA